MIDDADLEFINELIEKNEESNQLICKMALLTGGLYANYKGPDPETEEMFRGLMDEVYAELCERPMSTANEDRARAKALADNH